MGQKMNRLPVVVLLMILLFAVLAGQVPLGLAQSSVSSKGIQAVVGCLATKDFVLHDLEQIGLKPGDSVWIRIHVGSIPGMMPTPGQYYVAMYRRDGSEGWLLMADRDNTGAFVPVRNAYRLRRDGAHWAADEGNGGLATYKVMSRFATALFQSRRYRATIVTGDCAVGTKP
jgi:hypothetical protein